MIVREWRISSIVDRNSRTLRRIWRTIRLLRPRHTSLRSMRSWRRLRTKACSARRTRMISQPIKSSRTSWRHNWFWSSVWIWNVYGDILRCRWNCLWMNRRCRRSSRGRSYGRRGSWRWCLSDSLGVSQNFRTWMPARSSISVPVLSRD